MMKRLALIPLLAVLAVGCTGGDDVGDVETGVKAAQAAPKTPDQLPSDMPPEARRAAESAMAQQSAMAAHMQKMNQGAPGAK